MPNVHLRKRGLEPDGTGRESYTELRISILQKFSGKQRSICTWTLSQNTEFFQIHVRSNTSPASFTCGQSDDGHIEQPRTTQLSSHRDVHKPGHLAQITVST